jgi:hypothetical protein
MQHPTIAVDIAKSVFEVAVFRRPRSVSSWHRLTRRRFAPFLTEHAPARVEMEACGMAHGWGREAQARGHTVGLLPPRDVRPYMRGKKTDRSDAKALLEAYRSGRGYQRPIGRRPLAVSCSAMSGRVDQRLRSASFPSCNWLSCRRSAGARDWEPGRSTANATRNRTSHLGRARTDTGSTPAQVGCRPGRRACRGSR